MPARRPAPRLFVAVDPPATVRRELASWIGAQRRELAGVRPVPEEHLHVTLPFLGERRPDEVAPIADAVARVAEDGSALGLRLGAPLWLPPRRPRALTVELHDERGDLARLHAALADALAASIDWRPERRFRPHITVGRTRPDAPGGARLLAPTPEAAFDGEAVTLYRSLLEPAGARYVAVERMPLV